MSHKNHKPPARPARDALESTKFQVRKCLLSHGYRQLNPSRFELPTRAGMQRMELTYLGVVKSKLVCSTPKKGTLLARRRKRKDPFWWKDTAFGWYSNVCISKRGALKGLESF